MLSSAFVSNDIRAMDAVRTALSGLRIAATAHYLVMAGLKTITLELQNVVTEIELSGLRLSDSDLCKLLAAGYEAARMDALAGSEHGGYIIEMCRIALKRAEQAGLHKQEVL